MELRPQQRKEAVRIYRCAEILLQEGLPMNPHVTGMGLGEKNSPQLDLVPCPCDRRAFSACHLAFFYQDQKTLRLSSVTPTAQTSVHRKRDDGGVDALAIVCNKFYLEDDGVARDPAEELLRKGEDPDYSRTQGALDAPRWLGRGTRRLRLDQSNRKTLGVRGPRIRSIGARLRFRYWKMLLRKSERIQDGLLPRLSVICRDEGLVQLLVEYGVVVQIDANASLE